METGGGRLLERNTHDNGKLVQDEPAVVHGDIDALAATSVGLLVERLECARATDHRCEQVGNRKAEICWPRIVALGAKHQTRHCLTDHIECWPRCVRARENVRVSEARNG